MFGAAASQSSVFGQPAVSAFGATPTVGGLGTLQQQQPQTQQAQPQQPQQLNPQLGYPTTGQGSRVVQFSPETIKQADQTQQFRHICSMAQYADKSSEELRFEDYVTNCKGQPGSQPYPSVHPSKIGGSTGVLPGQAGVQPAFFILRCMCDLIPQVEHVRSQCQYLTCLLFRFWGCAHITSVSNRLSNKHVCSCVAPGSMS